MLVYDLKAKHITNEYAKLFKELCHVWKGYIQAINESEDAKQL